MECPKNSAHCEEEWELVERSMASSSSCSDRVEDKEDTNHSGACLNNPTPTTPPPTTSQCFSPAPIQEHELGEVEGVQRSFGSGSALEDPTQPDKAEPSPTMETDQPSPTFEQQCAGPAESLSRECEIDYQLPLEDRSSGSSTCIKGHAAGEIEADVNGVDQEPKRAVPTLWLHETAVLGLVVLSHALPHVLVRMTADASMGIEDAADVPHAAGEPTSPACTTVQEDYSSCLAACPSMSSAAFQGQDQDQELADCAAEGAGIEAGPSWAAPVVPHTTKPSDIAPKTKVALSRQRSWRGCLLVLKWVLPPATLLVAAKVVASSCRHADKLQYQMVAEPVVAAAAMAM